jgi:hypothetical protein
MEIYKSYRSNIEKAEHNNEVYKKLKGKAKIELIKYGCSINTYRIIDNSNNLSNDELALLCCSENDNYKLVFGYIVSKEDTNVIHIILD